MSATARHRLGNGWRETLATVFGALVIATLVRTLLFQPFWIPSGSMKETLLIGDFLFVNKFAYGWSRASCPFDACPIPGRLWAAEPERGDVVVFRHPVTGEDYVKRLIGLPGDRVQMRAGALWLNGVPLSRDPAPPYRETYAPQGPDGHFPRCENRVTGPGGDCLKARTYETLPNGRRYPVLSLAGHGRGDNTVEFTVPPGHFFVMGDNRDNSLDSRFASEAGGVGFVPFENLIGRADRVLFSSGGASLMAFWNWRPGRFWHAVE